jgi:hypothetical protein
MIGMIGSHGQLLFFVQLVADAKGLRHDQQQQPAQQQAQVGFYPKKE